MSLSETAQDRLQDVRELEPTTNSELQDRWGMDSGKDVAAYLRGELDEHTYRDENDKIRTVDDVDSVGDVSPVADAGPGETSRTSPSTTTQSDGTALESADETDTMEFTPEEFEEAARGAYETGYQEAQEEADPVEVESETVDDGTNDVDSQGRDWCPECGNALATMNVGETYLSASGEHVRIDAGDHYCRTCNAVVRPDGQHISMADADEVGGGSIFGTAVKWVGYGVVVLLGVVGLAAVGGVDGNDDDARVY